MPSIYQNVLSNDDLDYFNNNPAVIVAKSSIDSQPSGKVQFSVIVNNLICDTLNSLFGLNISVDSQIPMTWIKGDTLPHVDAGTSKFENTYLLYLNDCPGEFIIDSNSYPIERNTGFVFNEGLSHESKNTENIPRLLIGPMNEFAQPVGIPQNIRYFTSESDALSYTNMIGYSDYNVFTVGIIISGNLGGYTSWRIASNSIGPSSKNLVYQNGSVLDSGDYYNLYPTAPCFLEGSTVLCQIDGVEKYIPIENLTLGTLVKTSLNGYKPLKIIGKGIMQNPGDDKRTENRLYKCCTSKYPQLKKELFITGCHSILESSITEKQKEDTIKHLGRIFITDKKYRLMVCLDERSEPWNSKGAYTIWNFALENHDEEMNYGVYVNGGLLVETCSINFLKKKSNMSFN